MLPRIRALAGALVLASFVSSAPPAAAQDELDDVFRDLGTIDREAVKAKDEALPAERREGEGTIRGRVFDADTGLPVKGATVIVSWPRSGDGEPKQEVAVSDSQGSYEFASIPPGSYDLSFVKSGYRTSAMTAFSVQGDQVNRADFPLPPLPAETAGEVLELDAFVVEAATVGEMMTALELRMDSDQLLNIMSAEDLSKYAASDVAEALKRVAGVNIVEGQFAIIRGLEDRYSSTLYNAAPVPSPDPDRQSVQLDLFPSEIVSNLVVSKTAASELPSNSSGGSIDIVTSDYPEEIELKVKSAFGVNENAWNRYIEYVDGSPMGKEKDGTDALESEFGASIAGQTEVAGRGLRFKALANYEIDIDTAKGYSQGLEPLKSEVRNFPRPPVVTRSGDLSLGQLNLTDGKFDLTISEWSEQTTGYLGLGLDVDEDANHVVDYSLFYTRKKQEVVQLEENGYLNNFDYAPLVARTQNGQGVDFSNFIDRATEGSWIAGRGAVREFRSEDPSRGPVWYSNFSESKSFKRRRDLLITQLNGDHQIEFLPGFHMRWAANYARTKQKDDSLGARYFFEPDDLSFVPTAFPVTERGLGAGQFAVNNDIFSNENDIEEDQYFIRTDGEYERELTDFATLKVTTGGWFERAKRDVDSSFLESPTVNGLSQFAILDSTPLGLGRSIFSELDASGLRQTVNDSKRRIKAWHFGGKTTLYEDIDLFGGVRMEKIFIRSNNDVFTGETAFFAPSTFPPAYLFFDRLDNPARGEVASRPPPGTTFNDELLGVDVPVDPVTGLVDLTTAQEIEGFVNGRIDETKYLPSAGFAYRPIEGLTLRGAWSKTVARPSFREMGFYVSVEPASDDLIVGNPQLQLSDVESYDFRVEYLWGDVGDLFAFSLFYKEIQEPIESIVIRNPLNFEQSSSALFRTFFNNPNKADLWGIEVEARQNISSLAQLVGLAGPEVADYFSIGANYTYIDAEVDRVAAELERADPFFGTAPDDNQRFTELDKSRRLFGQPKWIVNADITFDQPDWGTKATLAAFAISDVLDAAGSSFIAPDGTVRAFVPDRYTDSFNQIDLIVSQELRLDLLPGGWEFPGQLSLKGRIKNLTDTKRKIVYDKSQTIHTWEERSVKVGRDYKFTLTYTLTF